MAVQADGRILAAGWFNGANSIGGQTRNRIARLDPTTGLADSFDPNSNGWVQVVVVQPDGRILVGGFFTNIGGQTRNYIARLDATTGLADSFNPNAWLGLNTIAVQADGKVLAGGHFAGSPGIGGQMRNHIARLDATTGLPDSFNPNANQVVYSIVVHSDGKILVGGLFTGIGGETRNYFARLSNDTGSLQDLAVTQTTVTWTRDGSSPPVARVTFEYSIDNVIYTPLGHGTRDGNNWTLTSLNLPTGQPLHPRSRLSSQWLLRQHREPHGISAECLFCRAARDAHSNATLDTFTKPHGHSDGHRYPYSNGYPNSDGNGHRNGNGYGYANGYCYRHRNGHTNTHTFTKSHSFRYRHPNCHGYTHRDSDSYGDTGGHSDSHNDANLNAFAGTSDAGHQPFHSDASSDR